MTWAARYSRTEQPELTIYRDGEEYDWPRIEGDYLRWPVRTPEQGIEAILAATSDPDLRTDIAARVPVTECEEPGCVNWAMPDGRCHHLHGGSDEL